MGCGVVAADVSSACALHDTAHRSLYLGPNQLSGTIPYVLGQLPGLAYVCIAPLNSHVCCCVSLAFIHMCLCCRILDVSTNALSGLVPESLVARVTNGNLNIAAGNTQLCGPHPFAFAKCTASQTDVLHEFYVATNGVSWTASDNWLIGDPCDNEWFGVTCDSSKNVV